MALFNLVTNALDAMPGGGTLSIAATARPDGIRRRGGRHRSGHSSEIMDRLFDPWVTTKPAGHGSGLGLAIVREVVRAHGGSISASNQPVGALFVIDFPAANVRQERLLAVPRILLVDDDAETCRFLEELLEAPGRSIRFGAGSRNGDRPRSATIHSIC